MARKKKKEAAPKLVAPDPPCDECEANLRWDRISRFGDQPKFFNGAHTAATDYTFHVLYDVKETAPQTLASERPDFAFERATTTFFKAEHVLAEAKDLVQDSTNARDDFKSLQDVEIRDAQVEKARFATELGGIISDLADARTELDTNIEQTMESFFVEQKTILNRLFNLVIKDCEFEDAFNERIATLQECDRAIDAYYSEHGKHVKKMQEMELETHQLQQAALDQMTETLHNSACQLTISSLNNESEKAAEDAHRTQLITELLKLQKVSTGVLERREEVVRGTTDLQRLVDLEVQKLQIAKSRNAHLKTQIRSLARVAEKPKSMLALPSTDQPFDAILPPPNEDGELPDCTNQLTEVRRQLDRTVRELLLVKDKVENLRRYHLLQLSGQYKPISLPSEAIKTTQNFLDPETNAAVRATVVKALLEVDDSLKTLPQRVFVDDDEPLGHLSVIATLRDRKAVQNYVAKKINKLFTSSCPTAPPLTLLEAAQPIRS